MVKLRGDVSVTGDRGEAGFTMVEVLIAMMLVSFVALSIAPLLILGVRLSAVNEEITGLLLAGSEQMELLRTLPFDDPALAAGGSLTGAVADYAVDPVDADPDRYLRWRIDDVGAHMKRIRLVSGVRVTVLGSPREVLLEAYRTDLR